MGKDWESFGCILLFAISSPVIKIFGTGYPISVKFSKMLLNSLIINVIKTYHPRNELIEKSMLIIYPTSLKKHRHRKG